MLRRVATFIAAVFSLTFSLIFITSAFGENPEHYGSIKPWFEENRGQVSGEVAYLQRGAGYTLFFTREAAVLEVLDEATRQQQGHPGKAARGAALRMVWEGAAAEAIEGEQQQAGQVNYLNASDSRKNITGIRMYNEIRYRSLYPGIDLVHYSHNGELEHDFHIAPGADPVQIVLRFEGADALGISDQGTLLAKAGEFTFQQFAPVAYQMVNGVRRTIHAEYTMLGGARVGFRVGSYDKRHELVIDPVLQYSTFVGGVHAIDFNGNPVGAGVGVAGLAVDKEGNAYFAGTTSATDYPTTPGAFNRASSLDCERGAPACASSTTFVTKLNAAGSKLVYSTYIGATPGSQGIDAFTIDQAGNAYFTSTNGCSDCSETPIAVTKLNASGSALDYSFGFGGTCGQGFSRGLAIAVNAAGEAYVAGSTSDNCLPVTANAFQIAFTNTGFATAGFILHLNAKGTEALDATYLASPPSSVNIPAEAIVDLKLDHAGDVYVTGTTDFPSTFPHSKVFGKVDPNAPASSFVTKLDPTLSRLIFSGEIAGASTVGLALDRLNQPYVTGRATNAGFPTTRGAFQTSFHPATCTFGVVSFPCPHAFITKLNTKGTALLFSTLVTGSGTDTPTSIAVGSDGDVFITGNTTSKDFPITGNALQKSFPAKCNTSDGACNPIFFTIMRTDGKRPEFSSFLSGHGTDVPIKIAVDSEENGYIAGTTSSADFPTTRKAFQRKLSGNADAFVSKIHP